ncbi:heme A synthase [Mechercharimyces sp. CAU 1602]|uniref:COX15/CtaA family protein n=1 Tax=Mechercharimyces sp. CAU 1602 TaxID=2973933 RepID=UPI0021620B33|nr:heme A synthase [Mechercharimyces sp. CAU 1602]MCS1350856.1 heme A synthase [Mechercharimyces sp. CAU 1602]
MQKALKGFSVFAAFSTYLILLMGALVTKTGSGEGCGRTWPFCHGEIFPSYATVTTMIEYSHRAVSGFVGLVVVILAVWAWRTFRKDFTVKLLAFTSVFFIVLQGLLGAATVVWGQEGSAWREDMTMALHFGFSLICFAAVALLSVYLFQKTAGRTKTTAEKRAGLSNRLRYFIWGYACYVYLVVYTGAYVRHAGATMGCSSFPLCGDRYLPDLVTPAGVQITHRLFAITAWVLAIVLLVWIVRHYRQRRDLYWGSIASVIFVTLQAASGIAVVLTPFYLVMALTHTTIVSLFFAALCYLCLQVGWPFRKNASSKNE